MGVVIKELTQPYKLTHKKLQQKWKRVFFFFLVVGFLERERERENFFRISRAVFPYFSHFFS